MTLGRNRQALFSASAMRSVPEDTIRNEARLYVCDYESRIQSWSRQNIVRTGYRVATTKWLMSA